MNKRIDQNAVSNFLCSLSGLSYQEAIGNAEMDAHSYGWSRETTAAIRAGISRHYFPTRQVRS